jgi:hypothetical protein
MVDIAVTIEGPKLSLQFSEMPPALRANLEARLAEWGEVAQDRMQSQGGAVGIPRRSGNLASTGFATPPVIEGDTVSLQIGFGAPYARILDEGGVQGPREIVARNATALQFQGFEFGTPEEGASQMTATLLGTAIYRRSVNWPGAHFKPMNFMQKVLDDLAGEFYDACVQAINDTLGGVAPITPGGGSGGGGGGTGLVKRAR